MYFNKHYIRTNSDNNITHGFSDAFEKPQDGDILINEQGGRHFELFGQRTVPLTKEGIPASKWDGREAVMRTESEIQADRDKQSSG